MRYNVTVANPLTNDLAESLATAAAHADLYHHALCQILDTSLDEDGAEAPAVCTCGLPTLLEGLCTALGVAGACPPVEDVWAHAEARLKQPCAV